MLVLLALATGCGGLTKGKGAAEQGIAHFHDLYNQSKFDQIWQDASPKFRAASAKPKYDEFMAALQRKLGNVVSTTNTTWNVGTFNTETTARMAQHTIFEKGQGTESFTFSIDGTNATMVGFNIESMDLITK